MKTGNRTSIRAILCISAVVALVGFVGCGDDSTGGDPCDNADCDPAATCTADGAGYVCDCPAGYADDNGDGTVCSEIDECAENLDDCDAQATCTNTVGGYTCECPAGYEDNNGDGTVCTEIDECADDLDDCDALAVCTNTDGGWTCTCPTGYSDVNGDGTVCTEIDECADDLDDCDDVAVCANTDGGWTCTCPMDHTDVNGDGTLCEPPTCTVEGDSHAISPTALDCCGTLVEVGCDAPDGSGGCLSCAGATYCTNCGDGICGAGENECRCPADCDFPGCIAEGSSRSLISPEPPCCAGLVEIPASIDSGGVCITNATISICANCGDGTCGAGENTCNCVADCPPVVVCIPEGGSRPVVPNAPPCCAGLTGVGCSVPDGGGGCTPCTGGSVCTNCGDGICGLGENECRCPADCP